VNRTYALLPKLLTILLLVLAVNVKAQTRYWVGGDGHWDDASHWSMTPDGPSGASVPDAEMDAVITTGTALRVEVRGRAECRSLLADAGGAIIAFGGRDGAEMVIAGAWSARGEVNWEKAVPVRLTIRRQGVVLDPRGARIGGDLVLDGSGSWSVVSDLHVDGAIRIRQGTIIANAARITAQRVVEEAPSRGTIIAGRSVWSLAEMPVGGPFRALHQPSAVLDVNGVVQQSSDAFPAGDRDINVCGTEPGQIPFTVNAQVVTNYNGYGVRCRGQCNATVTVTVTGGSGNFTYAWLNGGPNTATWTTACGGPQLVVVTDVGQGVSCPVQVNVSEPAPIGVIFFGQGTPPTCADVCNGTRTALAIGGVSPSTYDWNNGAGSNSSFSQLCAGLNTLEIEDANQCTFDTTFFFNVQPIVPNLTFTDAGCFGECDGTASVAPTGGTGTLTITWTPAPVNQGATSVSGLCAGNHSVRIADANGCDTTVTFIIAQPPPIDLAIQTTPATCSSSCDGSATVSPSGTMGPYTFAWTPEPGTGQGTANAGGLCAGVYTVLVSDVPSGCDSLVSITIDSPPAFNVVGTVTDASCSNTCDGGISLVVSGGSPGYTFLWTPAPPTGQGTAQVSGLCPGEVQVTISDVAGCDTLITYLVSAPPPLVTSVDGTDATCAGACDGEATVTVSGGVPAYGFVWTPDPGSGQGTATATGLCAGTYSVLVTDDHGCDTTLSVLINEPLPITATSNQTNVTCGGLCDGTASVVASGGNGGFTYVWTPAPATGQGTADATGFCAGPASVLITDVNGCTTTIAFLIADAVPLSVSLQVLPASCPGVCDGEAGVIVSGGTPAYGYVWSPDPGTGQGTPTATQLCPQAYGLTVTDAVGCDTTIAFTITAPAPIVPNAQQTDVACAGDCDGRITLAPTGGNGAFTYAWSPPPPMGQGTAEASGLCAGDRSVTITSGACDTTLTFTIVAPLPISASIATTDASCPGVCDGTATVSASGGTGQLVYTWGPGPVVGQGTTQATDLCPGAHQLTITDASGCDTTLAFNILDPLPMTVLQNKVNVSCSNLCDGAASVIVSGGAPDYDYLWTPDPATGQGTDSASGFCAGPVTLLITDANGCSITVPFNIEPASPILLSLQLQATSCPATCDGEAGVIASGGISPYAYSWSPDPGNGQGTDVATGLCAQAYSLTVTDAVGCDTTIAFTIAAPDPIIPNATRSDVSCAGGCDGTIDLAPTGGDGSYAYIWSPPPPQGQNTAHVSGLCAGDWSVTITSGTCDTTLVITIVEPPPITVDLLVTDPTCNGTCDGEVTATFTGGTGAPAFVWDPPPTSGQGTAAATGFCAGPHTLTITDAAGCDTTLAFVINEPVPLSAVVATTPETCAGPCTGTATITPAGGTGTILIDWQPAPGGGQGTTTATGLCAGTIYTVTLTDVNGCTTTLDVTVDPSAVIVPNSSSTPVTCNGACDGTATVGPTGGVEPYTYTWSPPPPIGQGTPSVAGLCPGSVQVTIVDATGCSVVAEVLILEPTPIVADVAINHPLCAGVCDGSIVLTASGGGAGLTYQWSPQPPVGQGTATITGLCGGTWNVQITDANGCTQQASYTTNEPGPIVVDVVSTPSQCQVCVGSATATFSGGSGALAVQWTNAQGDVVGNTATVTGLCAGLYTATITDDNACAVQHVVAITDTDGEALTVTNGTTSCPNVCDGSVSVSFTCSDPACSVTWNDADGNTIGTDVNALNGLCPGDYYVTVTNASGCITIDTATVVAPVVAVLNISSSPVSCTGVCDATATVGVASGTPPYTFAWDPPPAGGQGTPHATGLCAGVYQVTVGDGNGCGTTMDVLITEPPPLTLFNAIVLGTSCAGACNGNITLVVSGGSGSYDFVWDPPPASGQGSSAAFGYCAGNVSVTITDDNGCALQRTFTVTEPAPLTVSTTTTPSTCPLCDGMATATVTGGTGNYGYSWMLGTTQVSTDPTATGLCGGIYSLTVSDDFGCSQQVLVQVSDADAEVLDVVDGQTLCANGCDGQVEVVFTCSEVPCTIQWTDANGNVLGQDPLLAGLCTGVYTVQVTNGSGCVSIAEAQVGTSTIILPNSSSTPVSCPGACDATATVGPTGGVAPYTYTWSPQPGGGQGDPVATGLCAGVYEVLIADASGCDTTVQVLIVDPTPIAATAVITDVSCAGSCDGRIVVTGSGGTGAQTYTWDPVPANGQGSNGAFDLCAGTYTLTIADANGCSAVFTYDVVEPAPLVLAPSTTPSQCGLCDGQASVVASGGQDPYLFLWTLGGGIQGTNDTLSNICSGLYTVQVTDASGCIVELLVPVQDLNGEVLTTLADTTSCPGLCDGSAEVLFNCGIPTCTVAWYDASGNDLGLSSTRITGLCGGAYLATVTNGIGCLSIDTAIVAEPDPIIPNLSTTPVTCAGVCDGSATVGPTGGQQPYTIEWDPLPSNGQGNVLAEGLCAGNAQVTITDDAGCSMVQPFLVLSPDPLVVVADTTAITCNAACDGAIQLTTQGGTGAYTYTWDPIPPNGQGSDLAADLCAGTWSCVVNDANGCATNVTIDLVEPPLLEAALSTTDNRCHAGCEGTAVLTVTGGVVPYTILWTDQAGTTVATDTNAIDLLCADAYSVRVVDAHGCSIDLPFTISEGLPIDPALSFRGETCNGPCDGIASVVPTGGAGSFTYLWQPDASGQGTPDVTGLCAGNWSVTITDVLGCDTIVPFTILPFAPILDNATVTDLRCNSVCEGSITTAATGGIGTLGYAWSPEPPNGPGNSNATDLCQGDYSLIITDGVGCDSTFNYTITEPPVLEFTVDDLIDASCADAADGAIATTAFGGMPTYTFEWTGPAGATWNTEDLTGLVPGPHHLLLSDANACTIDTTIIVGAAVTILADAGADQQVCNGTSVTLDGSASTGVVTWSWRDPNGVEIGTTPILILPVLPSGDHLFTLIVSDGPCSATDVVLVTSMALPIADAGPDQTLFINETATLGGSPSGPIGSTYSWTPDSILNDPSSATPIAEPLVTTWFTLTVVAPNGCVDTDSVLVTVVPTVVIPSGFTPNGDGSNEVWQIDLIDLFPDCEVEVYNRWGEMLFRSVGYRQPWDGRYKDGFVPVGTYYYVIDLHDERFPEPYTGPLTIIR